MQVQNAFKVLSGKKNPQQFVNSPPFRCNTVHKKKQIRIYGNKNGNI
jgi:hypothetical protein